MTAARMIGLLLCAPAVCAVAAETPPEPPRVFFAEPRIATVVGERQSEVSFAMAHLHALDRYLEYLVGAPMPRGSGARVELSDVPGRPDVDARPAAGHLMITVRPGESQAFADRCAEAAALAWLGRASLSAGVAPSAEPWLVQALAAETLVQLRPALADLWLREASVTAAPSFAELTAGKASVREAFLLWRCLRQEFHGPEVVAALPELARGRKLVSLLALRSREPESWWPLRRSELLLSRSPVSLGMRESSEALDDIAAFVFDLGSGDALFTGPEIVPHRRLAAVKQGVETRLRGLRREIIRQNPVYHNAWRSLGLWLERFQDAEPAELEALWRQFEDERKRSRALHSEVESALKAAGG